MSERADLPEQLRELRDLARRARRLALSVSNGDRLQLLKHAEELEQQALELEQGIAHAPAPPPVAQEQMQVQQQQQHETGPPADLEKPESKDPT